MSLGDWSDHTWVTLFQESAELLFEKSAQEMDDLKNNNNDEYQQVFQQATFKSYTFKLRAQVQTYNVSVIVLVLYSQIIRLFIKCVFFFRMSNG